MGGFQVNVPRTEVITEMGVQLLPPIGVTTVMNFQPTADGTAAITSDFAFYMHFWANDDAVKLAQGLKAALDHTNSAKP